MEDLKKYIKVVYKSNPIGEYGIVLILTKFDLEAYKKDQEIKLTEEAIELKTGITDNTSMWNYIDKLNFIEARLNDIVNKQYKKNIEDLMNIIKMQKIIIKSNEALEELKEIPKEPKTKDVSNCDYVKCKNVYGDIINCNIVYCNDVQGDLINCQNITYKTEPIYKNNQEDEVSL